MMTYGEIEQAQEDANFAACRAAYAAQYGTKLMHRSESCEDGEWDCAGCPWRKQEIDDDQTTEKVFVSEAIAKVRMAEPAMFATHDPWPHIPFEEDRPPHSAGRIVVLVCVVLAAVGMYASAVLGAVPWR